MTLGTSGLRVLELPALTSVERLYIHSRTLTRFEAPALARAGGWLGFRWDRFASLTLPSLTEGCANLSPVPDCIAATAFPRCPPDELELISGCTCDGSGDLTKWFVRSQRARCRCRPVPQ